MKHTKNDNDVTIGKQGKPQGLHRYLRESSHSISHKVPRALSSYLITNLERSRVKRHLKYRVVRDYQINCFNKLDSGQWPLPFINMWAHNDNKLWKNLNRIVYIFQYNIEEFPSATLGICNLISNGLDFSAWIFCLDLLCQDSLSKFEAWCIHQLSFFSSFIHSYFAFSTFSLVFINCMK